MSAECERDLLSANRWSQTPKIICLGVYSCVCVYVCTTLIFLSLPTHTVILSENSGGVEQRWVCSVFWESANH